jgi:hypothetical protein
MTEKTRLSDLIRESYALAAFCAELASQETDEQERDGLLAMAQGWVHLAQSDEYAAAILQGVDPAIGHQMKVPGTDSG